MHSVDQYLPQFYQDILNPLAARMTDKQFDQLQQFLMGLEEWDGLPESELDEGSETLFVAKAMVPIANRILDGEQVDPEAEASTIDSDLAVHLILVHLFKNL